MDINNPNFMKKIAENFLDLLCLCAINSKSEIESFLLRNPSTTINSFSIKLFIFLKKMKIKLISNLFIHWQRNVF